MSPLAAMMQIVAAAERFRIARGQHRLHPPRLGVELHDAVHVVGDQDAAVAADLQAVRPAVIFDHQRPCPVRRDPEDAAEGNVDDVEIAVGVERRAFDEAIGRRARPVGVGPVGAHALAPEIVGHGREDLGLDQRGGVSRYIIVFWFTCRRNGCTIEDVDGASIAGQDRSALVSDALQRKRAQSRDPKADTPL